MCLQGGRFQVTLTYNHNGVHSGKAVARTTESGFFWFFNNQNAEVLVKVLDGTSHNGNFWLYHSAMTDVAYDLTVTDLDTGISKTYVKAAGSFCGEGDITTFTTGSAPKQSFSDAEKAALLAELTADSDFQKPSVEVTSPVIASKSGSCSASSTALCLQNHRFKVEVDYVDPNNGQTKAARTHTYGDESGFFYFFNPGNLEIGVKVLDGRSNNGHYWVFLSGATHVTYTVKVTDTLLGVQKSYPIAGAHCGQGDTQAFGNPDLRLQQGTTVINHNGNINLGNAAYNQSLTKTFTIFNDGTAALDIASLDWTGNDITVITPPPASIPKNGNGTFTLSFSGANSGNRSSQIQLTTNDLGPNPFSYNANWTVAAPIGPIIRLKLGNTVIGQNQTVNFGNTGVGQPLSRTFTVENIGDQPLTVAPIVISQNAGDPSAFDLGANNAVDIQPNASGTIRIDFDAAGLGTLTRLVRLFEGGTEKLRFNAKATVLAGDYNLSIGPSSRTIDAGQNAFYTVSVNRQYGHDDTVSLSISGLPSGAGATFTPYNVTGNSSQLKITTNSNIAPGTHPFTVTGTSGGITRTTQASLIVNDPVDFAISVTPASRVINQGASATYAVSVSPINGFNQNVTLSLTGLPPQSTQNFSPSSIAPGQNSTLTINTSANTPENTYSITIRGTHNGRVRTRNITLTVNEVTAGEPNITGIDPDHIDGGAQTVITLTGQNLQGASVAIATEPAEPGDPVPSAFPNLTLLNVNAAGTSMTVNVDARNAQVSGFYTLIVTTPGGETGAVFRVVTNGPQVDAWSPSKPVRGQVYQLLIMGLNMRNASVTSANSGIETVVVGTTDTHLNGFMFVADNASLGNTFLRIHNNGVTQQLPIEVLATPPANLAERNLFAEQAQRAAVQGVVAPEVFLQDLVFDPALAAASTSEGSANKALCFITLGWSIYRYNYTVLLPFDPLTGKIDRRILQGIALGSPIPTGVKVFSAFVDLYLEVQFRCFPVSHIQVCIYGTVGAEIPGIGGVVLTAGGCFFGGSFFPLLNTSGYLLNFRFGTTNQCASAAPITLPGEGGNQRADVTLDECCDSDLTVDVEGRSFPEFPAKSWDFSGTNVPVANITPGGSCNDCGCENVTNVPGHGTSPLQLNSSQAPEPYLTGPGKMKFNGTPAELANIRVIPEILPPNPTSSNLVIPLNGQIYEGDGFLVNNHPNCATMWFKVGNGCAVTINANGANPALFSGYYNCSPIGHAVSGRPEWRNSEICPIEDNWHNALTINPFADPTCRPTSPSCSTGRALAMTLNLIENPSFEDGTTAPFTSGVNRGTLTVETDPQHTRGGIQSLKHETTGDPSSWSPTAPWNGSNQIDFTVDGDDTYRFTAWAKAAAPNTRVRMFIFTKNAAGQTSAPYYLAKSFIIGTEWEELSLTHTMQPGYQYVTVRVDVREPGVVYWDDFRLEPVNNLIENPGFELVSSGIRGTAEASLFSGAQNGNLVLDKTQAHKGLASIKLEAGGNDCYTQYYHGANAAGLTKIETGEDTYRLTVRARADQNTPIQLRIFGLADDYTVVENQLANGTATTNWKEFTVTFTPSADSDYVSIRLDNDGGKGAIVWWDDVVFERVGQ